LRKKYRSYRDVPSVGAKFDYIQQYKLEKGCSVCGYNETPEALDLDHVNREEKKFALSDAWKYKWQTIHEELAKCVVLCANCHRKKTVEDKDYYSVEKKTEVEEVRQYDLFGELT